MTEREFLAAIINSEMPQDIKDYATDKLRKKDEANAKKKTTLSKEQVENEAIKTNILTLLDSHKMTASEMATELSLSTQKISSICTLLEKSSKITSSTIKVGKSKAKLYAIA